MVVLHLREVAVASLNRRRGPLERLGMLCRPRFPTRQQLRFKLSGAWMPLKHLFNRLEHERNLGFLPRVARARSCSCQYISGNNNASAHCVHLGVIAICSKS